MKSIKTVFSIGELAELSGIKPHTIRIWEKRYNLLSPDRCGNNLRSYSSEDLRKLLNVVLLTGYGIKISKVAEMGTAEIEMMVGEIRVGSHKSNQSIHLFKLSMMTFDQPLFLEATDHLLARMSFEKVFMGYYLPFLEEIGLMWQTGTIQPAHEHFISCLIRMVVIQQTVVASKNVKKGTGPQYLLFLPFGESHELGLMYVNYLIALGCNRSVYLGAHIPLDSLTTAIRLFPGVTMITYLTITPDEMPIDHYVTELLAIAKQNQSDVWVVGKQVSLLSLAACDGLQLFSALADITAKLS